MHKLLFAVIKQNILILVTILLSIVTLNHYKYKNKCLDEILHLRRIRFFRTLYINFRLLPFKQAIKYPIILFDKSELINLTGKIIFKGEIRYGLLQIGNNEFRSKGHCRFNIKGQWYIGSATIYRGTEITVQKNAILNMGEDIVIAENVSIFCTFNIKLGNYCRIAYNNQLFDTDFHYTLNTKTSIIKKKQAAIEIGNYNWIGNNTTIKKGVKTPDYTIVAASYSVLTKDYSKIISPYTVIGGIPAKPIADNMIRLWNEFSYNKKIDFLFESGLEEVCIESLNIKDLKEIITLN